MLGCLVGRRHLTGEGGHLRDWQWGSTTLRRSVWLPDGCDGGNDVPPGEQQSVPVLRAWRGWDRTSFCRGGAGGTGYREGALWRAWSLQGQDFHFVFIMLACVFNIHLWYKRSYKHSHKLLQVIECGDKYKGLVFSLPHSTQCCAVFCLVYYIFLTCKLFFRAADCSCPHQSEVIPEVRFCGWVYIYEGWNIFKLQYSISSLFRVSRVLEEQKKKIKYITIFVWLFISFLYMLWLFIVLLCHWDYGIPTVIYF